MWIPVILLLISIVVIFAASPCLARTRAILVVRLLDQASEKNSVQSRIGLEIDFPMDPMELFPLLVTCHDDGISQSLKRPVQFTVDYTFADFTECQACSLIYSREDPLYNAYFGYYSLAGNAEGLSESDLLLVTQYDMLQLALPASGLPADKGIFEIIGTTQKTPDLVISSFPFTTFQAWVSTNGPGHGQTRFVQDLLFGSPPDREADHPLIRMRGAVYHRYFAETDLNLIFLCPCPNPGCHR